MSEDLPRAERPLGPKLGEVRRGGSEDPIYLSEETRAALATRLYNRAEAAHFISRNEKRPDIFDRLFLYGEGTAVAEKLAGAGTLTAEEFGFAWAVVTDELMQKTRMIGRDVEQKVLEQRNGKFQRLRGIRVLGSLIDHSSPETIKETITTQVVPSQEPRISTNYTEYARLGYTSLNTGLMDEARIEKDIVALNNLRVAVEQSMGFGTNKEEWAVPDFQRGRGQRLHDAVVNRMRGILEREHGGKTYLELRNSDPIRAVRVLWQAMQEGVMCFGEEKMAKSLLKTERPKLDKATIELHKNLLLERKAEDASDEVFTVKQEQADALDQWVAVGQPENYEKIIALPFKQRYGDKFTGDQLSNTKVQVDGEIVGAELIREYIFGVIDHKSWINTKKRELARKMLSDKAIAQAIIYTFQIDTSILDVSADGKTLLKNVLPYLNNATRFQEGDTLRFMIQEGLRSAEDGNPYLQVPSYYMRDQTI